MVLLTECTINQSALTSAPFLLVRDDSVFAQVIATNIKGDSIESSEGNGAIILGLPDAPINLAEDT